jgi:hypothetical protein
MSGLGFNSLPTQNILSSLAGTQRSDLAQTQARSEATQNQNSQSLQKSSALKAEDVVEMNMDADRDADGRYFPGEGEDGQQQQQSQEDNQQPLTDATLIQPAVDPNDTDGYIGTQLNLDG